MDEYETIDLDATPGGIAVITLDRPDKHNAFNNLVIEELTDALETSPSADVGERVFQVAEAFLTMLHFLKACTPIPGYAPRTPAFP